MFTSSTAPENDYPEWVSTTTYVTGDSVQVTSSGYHKIYESLVDANTDFNPTYEANVLKWAEVSATNNWKMFDQTVSTQTMNNGPIVVELWPQESFDTIVFLNVEATNISVVMNDPAQGEVYNETKGMISSSGINDWFEYFFEGVSNRTDYAFYGLPSFLNATVTITIENGGNNALCGACLLGRSLNLGTTQYGASMGITDYSQIRADDWGNYNIVERAFSKKAQFEVLVENRMVDYIHTTLARYRATPCVYLGSDDYTATIVYGIFKDFSLSLADPGFSTLNLTVEGLT